MNNKRRTAIKKATEDFRTKLETLCAEYAEKINACAEEERDAFENLSENLQCSERGEKMEECADSLEYACSTLEEGDYFEDVLEALGMQDVLDSCEIELD